MSAVAVVESGASAAPEAASDDESMRLLGSEKKSVDRQEKQHSASRQADEDKTEKSVSDRPDASERLSVEKLKQVEKKRRGRRGKRSSPSPRAGRARRSTRDRSKGRSRSSNDGTDKEKRGSINATNADSNRRIKAEEEETSASRLSSKESGNHKGGEDSDDSSSSSQKRQKRLYREPAKYGTYDRNRDDDRSWRWQHDERTADDDRGRSPRNGRRAGDDGEDRRIPRAGGRSVGGERRPTQQDDRKSPQRTGQGDTDDRNDWSPPYRDSHRAPRSDRRSDRSPAIDERRTRRDDRRSPRDDYRQSSRYGRRSPRYDRGGRSPPPDRNHFHQDDVDRRSTQEALAESVRRSGADGSVDKEADDWLQNKRKQVDQSLTKAGGAYIPPAKLKMMQAAIGDKSSEHYQRLSWEHLKKRIHGNVNKVNVGNMVQTVQDLLQENIVRGKGLLARSLIQAQAFSPAFGHVYAALVAIINSKFPHIGELVLCRLIIQFKRAFRRNDKQLAITAAKFMAHLVNQQVVHEVLALEILTVLLENPTDDSVEVAVAFIKECGAKLTELTPRGMNAIFERLRSILHESEIDKRVQYMIEVLFHIRKDKFSQHPAVVPELDLVEEEDKITHTLMLDDAQDPQNILNVFRYDPDFQKNEEMYEEIKKEILGDEEESENEDEEDVEEGEEESTEKQVILDNTETNLVAFRRTVYLTIQSSLDFQEAIHKLLKMDIKPGMEVELCHMIIDCCAQQRTYEKFFGLMAERFCRLKKEFQENFQCIFKDTYDTIHRFEITKLRNTAKLFAHLFYTDAIGWTVLGHIRLNEDDTTSASRIFIKILFQELAEFMGLEKLYERIQDPTLQEGFDGLFPRDNPRDTRFSINFFTSIGLGGLTVNLREHLKSGAKQVVNFPQIPEPSSEKPLEKMLLEPSSSSECNSSSFSESEEEKSSSSEEEQKKKKGKKKSQKIKKNKKNKKRKKNSSSSVARSRHRNEQKEKKAKTKETKEKVKEKKEKEKEKDKHKRK